MRPPHTPQHKVIEESIYKDNHCVVFQRILSLGEHKLNIQIQSHVNEIESFAKISIFSPVTLQWNLLVDIHSSLMETKHDLYHKSDLHVMQFDSDTVKLLKLAKEILS